MVSSQHFRAGVILVVRNPETRQILAFERADIANSWQLPQGGIEVGEEPLDAAWRELAEETGLGPLQVSICKVVDGWTIYEWPKALAAARAAKKGRQARGQAHQWVIFDALTADVEPKPDGYEFVNWKWVSPQWLIDHVTDFRRPGYQQVLGTL